MRTRCGTSSPGAFRFKRFRVSLHVGRPHSAGAASGDAKVYLLVRKPTSWTAAVNSSQESVLQANLFYFPGWTSTVDGNEIPIHVSPNTGEIQTHVPAGEHRLKLELRRTAPRLCGESISAVALVVLFAACCFDGGPFPNSKLGRPILLPLLV